MMVFYHKYESLQHHLKKGDKEISIIILKRIYPTEEENSIDSIYNHMVSELD